MFIDVSDMGLRVVTHFDKRAVVNSNVKKKIMNIGTIPYIYITMIYPYDRDANKEMLSKKLKDIKDSELFKELIDVSGDRLDEYGWYVSGYDCFSGNNFYAVNNPSIKIFLHRKIDEKYVR